MRPTGHSTLRTRLCIRRAHRRWLSARHSRSEPPSCRPGGLGCPPLRTFRIQSRAIACVLRVSVPFLSPLSLSLPFPPLLHSLHAVHRLPSSVKLCITRHSTGPCASGVSWFICCPLPAQGRLIQALEGSVISTTAARYKIAAVVRGCLTAFRVVVHFVSSSLMARSSFARAFQASCLRCHSSLSGSMVSPMARLST